MVARGSTQRAVALWPGVLYTIVVSVHLALLVAGSPAYQVTQYLLMPPLIAFLLLNCRSVRSRLVQYALLAVTLSWLGDSIPFLVPKEWELALRLAFYVPVGVMWALAFWPTRRRSILFTRPQLMAPYLIALVGLISVCVHGAGRMWPLLALYGLLLGFVAVLATGLNGRATWASVLMIASAGVMGVMMFNPDFTVAEGDALAMLLYLVSQPLFVLAVLESNRFGAALLADEVAQATSTAEHAHR